MSTKLSDIPQTKIDWIWPQYFARGMLTILEGMPGEGKGLISLDAAARVTKGWPFPPHPDAMLPSEDRPVVREPASVILISGEGSRAHTEASRAAAAGADLSKIIVLPIPAAGSPRASAQELADRLIDLAKEEPIGLIILDPLEDAIPGLSTCDASTVRALLRSLVNASFEIGAALCGICQVSATSRAFIRGSGNLAISSVARFVFQVVRRRSLPAARILSCAKSGLCEPPPSVAFDVVSTPLGELISARVDWIGPSADPPGDPVHSRSHTAPSAVARAELFLLERLSDGPQPTLDLLEAADRAGLSEASLWRARSALSVKSIKLGFGEEGKWSWFLPQPPNSRTSKSTVIQQPGPCPVVDCTAQAAPLSRFCAAHRPAREDSAAVCRHSGCNGYQTADSYYCTNHVHLAADRMSPVLTPKSPESLTHQP